MLEDVADSITFSTASPDSFTSVTCVQCEPALIREEKVAPMVDLLIDSGPAAGFIALLKIQDFFNLISQNSV